MVCLEDEFVTNYINNTYNSNMFLESKGAEKHLGDSSDTALANNPVLDLFDKKKRSVLPWLRAFRLVMSPSGVSCACGENFEHLGS